MDLTSSVQSLNLSRKKIGEIVQDLARRKLKEEESLNHKAAAESNSSEKESDPDYLNQGRKKRSGWKDIFDKSKDENVQSKVLMINDNETSKSESTCALMARYDSDSEDEDAELMSLENALIDVFHSLVKEKSSLYEEINGLELEIDDMGASITDLKNQIAEVTRENSLLKNQKKQWINTPKEKEEACEAQPELEYEIQKFKVKFTSTLEKNRQLQEDLKEISISLNKSLNWSWSMNETAPTVMIECEGKKKIDVQDGKTPNNPVKKINAKSGSHPNTHNA
ncbi:GRIP domain-containing protein C119.12-like [Lycium ferocissimum]|uniref:GRIP domain-containing protein C119.12-like n=1 Tax=Lycium ferocissimum TaxID=112874 RepID=UPI002815E423|nr:GRIP domain-containing protein C119.12-like [Lycium ferocissimum]